jgi:hypothetical protein
MLKIEDFQFFQRSINSSNDQQNEQSITVLAELTEHKKTTTYDVGNPSPGTKMFEFMIL